MVRLEGISKSFGSKMVLKDCSLTVDEGERFVLLGQSGCGKTTLLRMIAGFDQPDQGRILIGGQEVVGLPVEQRPVGFIFQRHALFPHMNLSALDESLRHNLRGELMDMQRAFGITFLFVTHDQEEAMSLADRMSILEGGSLLQVGTPQTLYDQPADPFTASFLGEINRLEATVIQQSGNQVTLSLQEAGTLTALSGAPLEKNTRLNCYLRPERIVLRDKGAGEAANRLDGEVIQKLFFGNRIQYRVRLTNDCVLNVRIPYGESAVWEKGASVSLIFAAKDIYLFSS